MYRCAGNAAPASAQVDVPRAQEYFKEAQALCERDGGRLWGVSVCGPMVIYDRRTQTIATSQPAPEGARPAMLGLANAPVQWGGATWGAYVWDYFIGREPRRRNELFLHELFHGVQGKLGLVASFLASEHLDLVDGRYWLRLEWRALARALKASGDERNSAVGDALAFLEARRKLYPGSAENERGQEITEGLAAYTATVLVADSPSDAIASALDLLTTGETGESFVRTFAYTSGPAYGLLLDAASPDWRRRLRNTDDLGTLLMTALAVQPATDAPAAAVRYDGAELRASEEQREQQRQARIAELRQRFVVGPVLIIRGGGSGTSDSRGAVVIPGAGTVFFGSYTARVAAGTLEAEKGVLLASDGGSRRVPAPTRRDEATMSGDGWIFKSSPGWVVREGPRRGDYEVVRRPELIQFEGQLDRLRGQLAIPGMSAIVMRHDTIVWEGSLGLADVASQRRVTPVTQFHLASLTKTFASTIVLQLVEQGLVNLDDPVDKYGITLPSPGIIRVRHLMSHTSEGVPGEHYRYNGDRFALLDQVIQRATGESFGTRVMARIITPLALDHTAPNPLNAGAEMATGYGIDSHRNPVPVRYPTLFSSAAGLVSTARDVARYSAALDQGQFLSAATRTLAYTPSRGAGNTVLPYGLGWFISTVRGHTLVWHYGYWTGNSSLIIKEPSRGLTFVVLTNSDQLSARFKLGSGDLMSSTVAQAFVNIFVTGPLAR